MITALVMARCPETLGNAGQCVKTQGHLGQHSLFFEDGCAETVSEVPK